MTIARTVIGLVIGVVLAGCGGAPTSLAPTPSVALASASASSTTGTVALTADPTASPSATPAPPKQRSAAPPDVDLQLPPKPSFPNGAFLETATDGLRVRSKPGVGADSVKYEPVLPRGTYLHVLAGPEPASGYWWYRVELDDGSTLRGGVTTGWVAASDHDGEPWIEWVVDTDPGYDTDPVPDDLPVPVLVVDDVLDTVADGEDITLLSVLNWADYPSDLFAEAPEVGSCVPGGAARRTRLYVWDADTYERLNVFCGLETPEDLMDLAFSVKTGTPPPRHVYVVILDLKTGAGIDSNIITVPDRIPHPSG